MGEHSVTLDEARRHGDAAAATADLRPFFVLWTGQALSLVGSQAVQFALIWWLTRETGSATVLATATLVGLLPQVALGPLIGALVDRWNRKLVMLVADAVTALASAVLALLFLAGLATVPHVFLLLLVRAVGGALHGPAMQASTSLMVPDRHLTRIQGMNQSLQGGLTIVSAPLGAALVVMLPMAAVMGVDVVTALFAIVPLLWTHVPQPEPTETPSARSAGGSLKREIAAGFRYLAGREGLLAVVGLAAMVNLCLTPAFSLLPLVVLEHLGASAARLGWITSAFGVGMLSGGILLGIWGGFRRRIATSLAAIVVLGLATLGVAAATHAGFGATLAALFLVGLTVPFANGPILAALQAIVPADYQGRVFTLVGSLAGLMAPLGLLLAAPVAEWLGVRSWYLIAGSVCVLAGSGAFLVPSIAHIEDAPGDPTTTS
jgi:DHA3 family macrolide efflux protein-like MFS transporter